MARADKSKNFPCEWITPTFILDPGNGNVMVTNTGEVIEVLEVCLSSWMIFVLQVGVEDISKSDTIIEIYQDPLFLPLDVPTKDEAESLIFQKPRVSAHRHIFLFSSLISLPLTYYTRVGQCHTKNSTPTQENVSSN